MEKDRTFFTAQDIHSKLDPKKLNNLNVSDDRFAFVSWNQEKNKNNYSIIPMGTVIKLQNNEKEYKLDNEYRCIWGDLRKYSIIIKFIGK